MQTLLSMHEMKKELAAVEAYLDNYPSISNSALYTLHGGGKRLRPAFLLMTTMFFDNHEEYVIPLAASMEMIHMVSLIHDDIVDASDVRRGQATLNVRYGQRYALHTGDYILTKALQLINSAPHRERVLEILAKLSIEMCHGEIQQLLSVFDPYQTVEDYNYRIDRKTALLIAVCCQSGAVISSADEKMVQLFYDFGYNLGMAFQIKDDILTGDVITVTTKTGNKTVTLTRNGVDSNILNRLVSGSTWLTLKEGTNTFRVEAVRGVKKLRVTLMHRNSYLGV